MMIFGKPQGTSLQSHNVEGLIAQARTNAAKFATTPISTIVDALHAVGQAWLPDGKYFKQALNELPQELNMSREMLEMSLRLLPEILKRDKLMLRIRADFGDPKILGSFGSLRKSDRLGDAFDGRVTFVPHGVLLHVSAGNIFLGAVDSLVLGFLTKNVSILKVSSHNQLFPKLFSESIASTDAEEILTPNFAILHWKGGDEKIERKIKNSVDAILAWGGDDMVRAYRKELEPGIPLIEHGPKISFQVITKAASASEEATSRGQYFAEIATGIARDISLWDQAACASPQNLFVEEGVDVDTLLLAINEALKQIPWPRATLSSDEETEILKEEQRAIMTTVQGGKFIKGESWLLHFDPRPGIRPSPLNRTLIVKTFKGLENLKAQLEPARKLLQSCSYLLSPVEKEEYLRELSRFGVLRFAPLGTVMEGILGAPHDGRLSLMELGRLVADETPSQTQQTSVAETETVADADAAAAFNSTKLVSFVNHAIETNEYYGELYKHQPIKSLSELVALKSFDLPLPKNAGQDGGHIFSSGGTSGKPKFVYFSTEEFKGVGAMLARGYRAQNLKPGAVCANLFVAGNLWSSFLAIDEALKQCGAVQLPIGGTAEPKMILQYLSQFKPEAVFGLPSMLIDLATKPESINFDIKIKKVFYAGEHLTAQGRKILAKAWGIQEFHSAGYASVDAGPIGYQCPHCEPGEHHLFEDFVHLEIQNDEGIVTSLLRRQMPVIHLRTGDHIEWAKDSASAAVSASASATEEVKPCACGSFERKFILHGRVDGQIRIWSSRVMLSEIESALLKSGVNASVFQVVLDDDTMTVRYEGSTQMTDQMNAQAETQFQNSFYELSKDFRATLPSTFLNGRLFIKQVSSNSLERVPRTGKIRPVLDLRQK